MENHVTMTTANDDDVEIELPVEIIQRIQSMIQYSSTKFTGEKAAARTSLVSKSWYRAWSTRPDLAFCRYNFRSSRGDQFWEVAKTTLERYEDLNLSIRSLRLVMIDDGDSLAKELIVKAIKLGVVDLTFQILYMSDHCFPEDNLEFQDIARSNLSGCGSFTINLSLDRRREKGEVTCYNLKSLKLKNMALSDDLFRDLKLRCPFIEEFLGPLYDTSTNLKDDEFLDQFPKLEYLSLRITDASLLPRHDLWAKFSCLKILKIDYHRNDDLRIRIPSLERLSIILSSLGKVNVVEFDFPNIRKLKLEGGLPWCFELKTSSSRRDEWESKIDILYMIEFGPELFRRLSQVVRTLSVCRSRVSLSIDAIVRNWDDFTYYPRYFGDGLAIPRVEKLTLRGLEAVTPAFLDALFWSCRPEFVKIKNQCLPGVEEVNVEVFQQLRLLPRELFYQVSSHEYGYEVGFRLN